MQVEVLDGNTMVSISPNGLAQGNALDKEFLTIEAADLNTIGVNLGRQGDYQEAKSNFLEALIIEPKNPTLLSNIGLVEMLLKNMPEAIEYFQRALLISDSTYLNAAANLGLTYYKNFEYHKAIEISEYLISKTDDRILLASAYITLTLVYIDIGRCHLADELIGFLEGVAGDSETFKQQARGLRNTLEGCIQNSLHAK